MAKAAKKAAKVAKPRKPKADKPAAPPKEKKRGHNLADPQTQALFLQNLEKQKTLLGRMAKIQGEIRAHGKVIKADGFTMRQIKFAIQLQTPEGEATAKSLIANDLLAAQYIGADMGEQLSLFLDEPRVPIEDRAAKEGQADALAGKSAKPSYDPSTAAYRAYMEAWHAAQKDMLEKGIKPLDEAANGKTLIKKSDKDAAAAKRDAKPPTPPKPVLSQGTTHKQQSAADKAAKQQAKETAEKYFKPTGDFTGTA